MKLFFVGKDCDRGLSPAVGGFGSLVANLLCLGPSTGVRCWLGDEKGQYLGFDIGHWVYLLYFVDL